MMNPSEVGDGTMNVGSVGSSDQVTLPTEYALGCVWGVTAQRALVSRS